MNFKNDKIPYQRILEGNYQDPILPRFYLDGAAASLYPADEPTEKFKVPVSNLKIKLSSLVEKLYDNLRVSVFLPEEIIVYFLWKALNMPFIKASKKFKISKKLKTWSTGDFLLLSDIAEPEWKIPQKEYLDYESEDDKIEEWTEINFNKFTTVLLFSTFGQRISKTDYNTGISYMVHLIENVKALCHGPPYSQSAEDIGRIKKDPNSYYTIRANKTLKLLCSILDYFLIHSDSEEIRTLRVSTITSRYEDQAGASSFLQLLEACPAETGSILSFIHSPELAAELDVIYHYEPFKDPDHFWPYSSCANLIQKSAFSSVEMKNLYVMVAMYMGSIGQTAHFNKFLPNGQIDVSLAIGYHLAKNAVSAFARTPQFATTLPSEATFLRMLVDRRKELKEGLLKFDTELCKNLKYYYSRVEMDSARLTVTELTTIRNSIINPRDRSLGQYLKGAYAPYTPPTQSEEVKIEGQDPEEILSDADDEEFPAM